MGELLKYIDKYQYEKVLQKEILEIRKTISSIDVVNNDIDYIKLKDLKKELELKESLLRSYEMEKDKYVY